MHLWTHMYMYIYVCALSLFPWPPASREGERVGAGGSEEGPGAWPRPRLGAWPRPRLPPAVYACMYVIHQACNMDHIWRVEAGAHACIRYIQQTCTCTLHTRASTLNPKPCIHVYICDRQTHATCTYAPHPVSHHHVYMSHHHISYTSVTDKHMQLAHTRHTLHPTQIQPLHTRLVRDSETLGFRV